MFNPLMKHMKKVLIIGGIFISIVLGSMSQAQQNGINQSAGSICAFNNEQIVNGVTIQDSRWIWIKLRIQNERVCAFSFGARDMAGNIIWTPCNPVGYRTTNRAADGNDICWEYKFTATLSGEGFTAFEVYF